MKKTATTTLYLATCSFGNAGLRRNGRDRRMSVTNLVSRYAASDLGSPYVTLTAAAVK